MAGRLEELRRTLGEGFDQYMPRQRRDHTYVSRLQAVQVCAAVGLVAGFLFDGRAREWSMCNYWFREYTGTAWRRKTANTRPGCVARVDFHSFLRGITLFLRLDRRVGLTDTHGTRRSIRVIPLPLLQARP